MGEADASADDGNELACNGRAELRRTVAARHGTDQLQGGIAQRSCGKQSSSGLLRQRRHAGADELVQRVRDAHSRSGGVTGAEGARKLQREERVAPSRLVHGPKRRAGENDGEPLLQQPVQRCEAESLDSQSAEAGQGRLRRERRPLPLLVA